MDRIFFKIMKPLKIVVIVAEGYETKAKVGRWGKGGGGQKKLKCA